VNYFQNYWSITGVESVIKVECIMSTWCGCCECEFRYSQMRTVTRFCVIKVSNHQPVSAAPQTIICCHKLNTVMSTH
jgi:hypothetical protein